jgi:predicted O-methyltransferase YrrM
MKREQELEKYILDHITPEDALIKELSRKTHLKILRPRMLSGHLQGQFLYLLCKMINPRHVLEIGTYTGYSALCMARGLDKGATLDTIEINDELRPFIEEFINKSEYKDVINLHTGSALDIGPMLNKQFDLVFIDGDKREYSDYYNLVFDSVSPGGYILADNVLWDGKVLDEPNKNDDQTIGIREFNNLIRDDQRIESVILPIRDGITIIRKKE